MRPEEQSVRHERKPVRPEEQSVRHERQSVLLEEQSGRPEGQITNLLGTHTNPVDAMA